MTDTKPDPTPQEITAAIPIDTPTGDLDTAFEAKLVQNAIDVGAQQTDPELLELEDDEKDDAEATTEEAAETAAEGEKPTSPEDPGAPEGEPEPDTPPEPQATPAEGLALIAEREAKLREHQEAFAAQQHAAQQATKTAPPPDDVLADIKARGVQALEERGIKYEWLANQVITGQLPDAAKMMPAQTAMDDRLTRVEGLLQQRVDTDVLKDFRVDVEAAISSDAYSILRTHPDPVGEIEKYARGWVQKTGQMLPVPEIANRLQAVRTAELEALKSNKAAREILGLGPADTDTSATPEPGTATPAEKPGEKSPTTITKKMQSAKSKAPQRRSKSPFDDDVVQGAIDKLPGPIDWSEYEDDE